MKRRYNGAWPRIRKAFIAAHGHFGKVYLP